MMTEQKVYSFFVGVPIGLALLVSILWQIFIADHNYYHTQSTNDAEGAEAYLMRMVTRHNQVAAVIGGYRKSGDDESLRRALDDHRTYIMMQIHNAKHAPFLRHELPWGSCFVSSATSSAG